MDARPPFIALSSSIHGLRLPPIMDAEQDSAGPRQYTDRAQSEKQSLECGLVSDDDRCHGRRCLCGVELKVCGLLAGKPSLLDAG